MNIGILTLQGAQNVGAVLQAYALTKVINGLEHRAELINFISDREAARSTKGTLKQKGKAYWARKLYYLFFYKSIRKRKKLFDEFREEYLQVVPSDRRVREDELYECTKKYDCLVCGSDQIWSQDTKLYDRSDAYFIDFPFEGKKISYAASFGDNIDSALRTEEKIIPLIKEFHNISVRETEGKAFLNRFGIEADVCVDPTILLSADEWKQMKITPKESGRYILYFSVNSRRYSINIAKKLSKMTGLKVIELNPHPKSWNSGFVKKYGNGPREFLGYIMNAEYIVTNSFHGTVFSVLFNKPFLATFDEKNNEMIRESRKADLLEAVGLQQCMIKQSDVISEKRIEDIDWSVVNQKVHEMRNDSMKFLIHSLGM